MATTITFPPIGKEDFNLKTGDTGVLLVPTLLNRDGTVVDLSNAATQRFRMRLETATQFKVDNTSRCTVVTDPTFTADAATDTCTATAHGLENNRPVMVKTSSALPGGLSAYAVYYVVNAQADTFQLADAPRGNAVDITSTGTGTHTLITGRLQYEWVSADTNTAGNYYAEFEVTFQNGQVVSFPNGTYIMIRILQS